MDDLTAIAVTIGPGLALCLKVKRKKLCFFVHVNIIFQEN